MISAQLANSAWVCMFLAYNSYSSKYSNFLIFTLSVTETLSLKSKINPVQKAEWGPLGVVHLKQYYPNRQTAVLTKSLIFRDFLQ